MELNIERRESGPSWMDASSVESEADQSGYTDMIAGFEKAARDGDANALAAWAPLVTDWDAVKRQPVDMRTSGPQRVQTLSEVMVASLDFADGPSMVEAMQLLLNVAYSADLVNTPSMARGLIERMGRSFAFHNSGVE